MTRLPQWALWMFFITSAVGTVLMALSLNATGWRV